MFVLYRPFKRAAFNPTAKGLLMPEPAEDSDSGRDPLVKCSIGHGHGEGESA